MKIVTYCVIDNKDNECSDLGHFIILESSNEKEVSNYLSEILGISIFSRTLMDIVEFLFGNESTNVFYGEYSRYEILIKNNLVFV